MSLCMHLHVGNICTSAMLKETREGVRTTTRGCWEKVLLKRSRALQPPQNLHLSFISEDSTLKLL